MQRKRGMTTGEVARQTGIPQQTLISWDRSGVLTADRPARRSSKRAPRVYDAPAITAALFARSMTFMGFKGDVLKQMIAFIQSGEAKALETAAIFTYRSGPGLMKHVFTPELASEDIQRWLEHLRERQALLEEPTRLRTLHEYFLPQAKSLIRMGDGALIESVVKENR